MRNPPLSMSRAALASLLMSNSSRARLISAMSSSMSWGSVAILGSFAGALVDKLLQEQTRDHVQRLKDSITFVGAGREGGYLFVPVVEKEFQVFRGRHVREIALVVLQDVGNVSQVQV